MSSAQEIIGHALTGVVTAISEERDEYRENVGEPGRRRVRVRTIDLFLKSNITVVLSVRAGLEVAVGEVVRIRLELAQFESRAVLYGSNARVLRPEMEE
jgi:hypothetical protein